MTKLKTVDIKGKDYVEVSTRITYFRSAPEYKGWALLTEIVELDDKRCTLKGIVKNEIGEEKATGLAYELAGSSFINKGSYIENCETSAWGRALGNLGIGIDGGVASAEEVTKKNITENNIELMTARVKRAKKGKVAFDNVIVQFKKDYGDLPEATISELRESYENS